MFFNTISLNLLICQKKRCTKWRTNRMLSLCDQSHISQLPLSWHFFILREVYLSIHFLILKCIQTQKQKINTFKLTDPYIWWLHSVSFFKVFLSLFYFHIVIQPVTYFLSMKEQMTMEDDNMSCHHTDKSMDMLSIVNTRWCCASNCGARTWYYWDTHLRCGTFLANQEQMSSMHGNII